MNARKSGDPEECQEYKECNTRNPYTKDGTARFMMARMKMLVVLVAVQVLSTMYDRCKDT